jgi:hypothetical protein
MPANRPDRGSPLSLKPQDICVLLKIVALDRSPWSYGQLAYELGMSASEVHAGVKRATEASLMRLEEGWGTPDPEALEELLVHGVKYVFTPAHGGLTRGMPTSYAAPPLNRVLARPEEPPPVWPDEEGEVRGYEFSPLYKSVPFAARRDAKLYELLALVDAIRGGGETTREAAIRELRARLGTQSANGTGPALTPPEAPGSRAAASRVRRGGNGQEKQRVYRRRHRDS